MKPRNLLATHGPETVNLRQTVFIGIMFLSGGVSLYPLAPSANRDAWLAVLLAVILTIPVFLMFAAIVKRNQDIRLVEIPIRYLGPLLGKIVQAGYIIFFLLLTGICVRTVQDYITTTSLTLTPGVIVGSVLILLSIMAVKAGVETMGRFAEIVIILPFIALAAAMILVLPKAELTNIRPILRTPLPDFLTGIFQASAFSLCSAVGLVSLFTHLNRKNKAGKALMIILLFSGLWLVLIALNISLVMGKSTVKMEYYATFKLLRHVHIEGFLQRIEIVVSVLYIIGVIVRTSVSLLSASQMAQSIFELGSHRPLVVPLGFWCLVIAQYAQNNNMEMVYMHNVIMPWLSLIFSIIVPFMFFLMGLRKKKKKKLTPDQVPPLPDTASG